MCSNDVMSLELAAHTILATAASCRYGSRSPRIVLYHTENLFAMRAGIYRNSASRDKRELANSIEITLRGIHDLIVYRTIASSRQAIYLPQQHQIIRRPGALCRLFPARRAE